MSYKQDLQQINGELQEVLDTANDLPAIHALSGKPILVSTEDAMTAILKNATEYAVGSVYKYIGETTETYIQDAIYILAEEE